jgi:AraC-like DNA-binding protein
MNLSFETFRRQAYRMRGLMDFIGQHLDNDLCLEDLADFTHLSVAHLLRLYQHRVGETPMKTIRRLRLQQAWERICENRYRTLTDIGVDAGYGSSAAFSHAFRRQFGIAPTDVPTGMPSLTETVPLHLEFMPALKVWQIPYAGNYADNGYFKARLAWQYLRTGRKGWRGWRLNDRDHPFCESDHQYVQLSHFLPVLDSSMPLCEAESVTLPGGLYAVARLEPAQREACLDGLPERVRAELGCQCVEGRMIERDLHIRDFRAPQERRIALYIPVARLHQTVQARPFSPLPIKC